MEDWQQPSANSTVAAPSEENTTRRDLGPSLADAVGANEELAEMLRAILDHPGTSRLRHLGEVARGGMGTVHAVVDEALLRRSALKVLHDDPARASRRIPAFLREAQITAQLDHPNIVPVHDVGVDMAGNLHFSMKLVEGQTLRAYVEQLPVRPLDSAELVGLLETFLKVCDAVAFAHARGVVHCDLTPVNVMVGKFGQVYVMDWGIARPGAARHTPAAGGAVVTSVNVKPTLGATGTPAYMSPEHVGAGELDDRSDVFQLGGLLYFALTRQAPYQSDSREFAIMRARICEFPAPREVSPWAHVPIALERIILKAMAEDPADRFATATELREAIVRFMWGGELYASVKVPAGEHVVREGELGECAYILASGTVEVYRMVDGQEVALRTMGAGEVFGEMAVLTASARTASVRALEDCELHVVSAETLQRELEGMKPWMGALTRALAKRFKQREDELLGG